MRSSSTSSLHDEPIEWHPNHDPIGSMTPSVKLLQELPVLYLSARPPRAALGICYP